MSAPTYAQLKPADTATLADVSAVSLVWTEDPADHIDLAQFKIKRGAVEYAVTIIPQGGGVYRVEANVGLFPDQKLYTVTAIAKSLGGATATVTWTFTTRGPFGGVRVRGDIGAATASAARALGDVRQIVGYSAARVAGSLYVQAHIAGRSLGQLTVREFRVTADRVKGKIVIARQFLKLGGSSAIEVGDPTPPVAVPFSVEARGLVPALHAPASLEVRGVRTDAGIGSLEAGPLTKKPAPASIEAGDPVKGESPGGVEVQEGSGPALHITVVDEVMAAARE